MQRGVGLAGRISPDGVEKLRHIILQASNIQGGERHGKWGGGQRADKAGGGGCQTVDENKNSRSVSSATRGRSEGGGSGKEGDRIRALKKVL